MACARKELQRKIEEKKAKGEDTTAEEAELRRRVGCGGSRSPGTNTRHQPRQHPARPAVKPQPAPQPSVEEKKEEPPQDAK